MMKKLVALPAAGALCVLAVFAYACSSAPAATDKVDAGTPSGGDSGSGRPSRDGSMESGTSAGNLGLGPKPGAASGSGRVDGAGVAQDCPGKLGPQGYWGRASAGPIGSCTEAQIRGWATACVDAETAPACQAFVDANRTCSDCMTGTDTKLGATFRYHAGEQVVFSPNFRGCVSRIHELDDECFAAATNSMVCRLENCAACSAGTETTDCTAAVIRDRTNGCGLIEDALSCYPEVYSDLEVCGEVGNFSNAPLEPYVRTAMILCGPAK